MNQLRNSDEHKSNMPATHRTNQRESLLSLISRVKSKEELKNLNAEERASIASQLMKSVTSPRALKAFLGDQNLQGLDLDNWQPNLQMFESMLSAMSANQTHSASGDFRASDSQPEEMKEVQFIGSDSSQELGLAGAVINKQSYEFSFDQFKQKTDEMKPTHARQDSIGRQNAKARLAALK